MVEKGGGSKENKEEGVGKKIAGGIEDGKGTMGGKVLQCHQEYGRRERDRTNKCAVG